MSAGNSPLQPQNVEMGGGVGGVSRLRFPPGPHLRSSRFSRHPRLRQAPPKRFAKNRNLRGLVVFVGKRPQAPGGPGPKPQAPWRPGPQAPGAWIPPLSPLVPASQVFNFLFPSSLQHFSRCGRKPLQTWPTSP